MDDAVHQLRVLVDCEAVSFPIESEATRLLHDSPLALLLGMLLEQ